MYIEDYSTRKKGEMVKQVVNYTSLKLKFEKGIRSAKNATEKLKQWRSICYDTVGGDMLPCLRELSSLQIS